MSKETTDLDAVHPLRLLAALTDKKRLAVFAAVVQGAAEPQAISEASELSLPTVKRAVTTLVNAGLIEEKKGALVACPQSFASAAKQLREPAEDFPGETSQRAIQLRKFFKDGRLQGMPTSRSKRLIVLDYVSRRFEPGHYYSEAEVNSMLKEVDGDHATLRRYLVDEGFLERDSSRYWRAGGTFAVD